MRQAPPITIMLADDQAIFRAGLRRLFAASPDLQIVGEGAEHQQALQLLEQLHPAILLLNIRVLGPEGLADLATWRARSPRTKILLLIDRDEQAATTEALQHGAQGVLSTQLSPRTFRKALRVVHAGELWASRKVVAHAVEMFRQRLAGGPGLPAVSQAHLTAREREIAHAVGQGLTNQEIATQLGISAKTVKTHLHVLFQKLGIQRRHQLRRFPFPP